jgi:2-oxo-4-hydroxy-4-carboxy-5-ureidoimidazoline decarboxylase
MNTQTVDFDHLNSLDGKSAVVAFLKCSGSQKWSEQMVASRPFNGLQDLRDKSEAAWAKLNHQDWLEAFTSHPKIGDVHSLREKFASTAAWARGEQESVSHASEQILHGLSDANRRYEETCHRQECRANVEHA